MPPHNKGGRPVTFSTGDSLCSETAFGRRQMHTVLEFPMLPHSPQLVPFRVSMRIGLVRLSKVKVG